MKKLFGIIAIATILTSCSDANINDAVVVERIDVLENTEGQNHKYKVKLKTSSLGSDAFYYTDYRFQVGDSLISYYEYFDKNNSEIARLKKENDSLKKELSVSNFYLQMLKEKILTDTIRRK